jgi:hypothetical protein
VRDFQDIYFRYAPRDLPSPLDDGWRDAITGRPGWSALCERHWPNPHSTTVADVVERMMSSSHIVVLDPDEQRKVRAQAVDLLERQGATSGEQRLEMPYTTDVYWLHRQR